MVENFVNTRGCIQNNCLDVFCIAEHCIIKVSDPGPSWPSCLVVLRMNISLKQVYVLIHLLVMNHNP